MSTFAFDYHETFTVDLDGMRSVVKLLQSRGHTCVLVTGISSDTAWSAEVRRQIGDTMPIVFANGAWKEEAAKLAGFAVDIWIDDHPEGIRRQTPEFIRSRGDYTKELLEKK